ncbi:MAG TPA: NUDIX hydrolase [Chloroflexia bacterium]|nr:NUDIX hydrolase [Chloroflexia bacterium]
MHPDLAAFLSARIPVAEEDVSWDTGRLRLHVRCYLGADLPPPAYITSVRAIVLRAADVLVMRNPDATHILPGGRREEGETLEATLHREVLEETGWAMSIRARLGVLHFHHLTPRPPEHSYPYPDFLQVVYGAVATQHRPAARLANDYEQAATFRPIAEIDALATSIGPSQICLLAAAIEALETT